MAEQTHFKSLGLNALEISITLLSGPLCGAFLQPLFGSWSDQFQSRWGRRKPFIIAGTAALILAIFSLAWAESITQLLLFSSATRATHQTCLVAIAMLSALSFCVAVQPVQLGLRTLITDDLTELEQAKANAWASTYSNLAATLANCVAYTNIFPLTRQISQQSHTVFTDLSMVAILSISFTVVITCISVREEQTSSVVLDGNRKTTHPATLRSMWKLLSKPSQIRTVYLVQFFAWLGWFPFLYYAVTYDS